MSLPIRPEIATDPLAEAEERYRRVVERYSRVQPYQFRDLITGELEIERAYADLKRARRRKYPPEDRRPIDQQIREALRLALAEQGELATPHIPEAPADVLGYAEPRRLEAPGARDRPSVLTPAPRREAFTTQVGEALAQQILSQVERQRRSEGVLGPVAGPLMVGGGRALERGVGLMAEPGSRFKDYVTRVGRAGVQEPQTPLPRGLRAPAALLGAESVEDLPAALATVPTAFGVAGRVARPFGRQIGRAVLRGGVERPVAQALGAGAKLGLEAELGMAGLTAGEEVARGEPVAPARALKAAAPLAAVLGGAAATIPLAGVVVPAVGAISARTAGAMYRDVRRRVGSERGAALVGAAAGAGVGAATAPEDKSALEGAAAGALLGAGVGAVPGLMRRRGTMPPRAEGRLLTEAEARARRVARLPPVARPKLLDELEAELRQPGAMRKVSVMLRRPGERGAIGREEPTGPPPSPESPLTPEQQAAQREAAGRFVNLSKVLTDPEGQQRLADEVQRVVQLAQIEEEVVPWATTKSLATRIARQWDLDPKTLPQLGGRLSGPEMLAVRDIVSDNVRQLVKVTEELNNPALAPERLQELQLLQSAVEGQNEALLRRFIPERSRAGRELNSLKIVASYARDPLYWVTKARTLAGRPLAAAEQARIVKLATEAQQLTGPAKTAKLRELAVVLDRMRKSTPLEKASGFFKANLLTLPATHVVNTVSNTLNATLEQLARVPGAGWDWFISKSLRGQVERTLNLPTYRGLPTLKAAKLRPPEETVMGKLDASRRVNYENKILDAYVNGVFNLLGVADRFWHTRIFRWALAQEVKTWARNTGTDYQQTLREIVDAIVEGKVTGAATTAPVDDFVMRAILAGLGVIGFEEGGEVPIKRAAGGPIPGPNVDRDVVPAMLTPGEFVMRRDAVEKYGRGVMYALNRGLVPPLMLAAAAAPTPSLSANLSSHFAEGGEVPFGAGASPKPAMAFIVSSDSELDRLVSGGDGALIRFFERNRGKIRSVLGTGGR